MKSCIYAGSVRHRRFGAVGNDFRYRIFMMYLDLGELPTVFSRFWLWSARRPAPAWFSRRDHYGDTTRPLDECIRDLVAEHTGRRPTGPIRLLTHLRYFGYCFNPLSVYYVLDHEERIEDVVLEVNNTPWGERHCYVLPREGSRSAGGRLSFEFAKEFHVSPFLPMDMTYRCRVTAPEDRLYVGLENWRAGEKAFDAHLALAREPITAGRLARHLALDPLVTGRVLFLIMWQALRLWWLRAPFFPHPRTPDGRARQATP